MSYATSGINNNNNQHHNINYSHPTTRIPVKMQNPSFSSYATSSSQSVESNIVTTLTNQEILINYAVTLRNSIVANNNNILDLDTKLFYAMDFISQKISHNNLFVDEVIDLYQQIELAVKNGTKKQQPNTKQFLIEEFLINCLSLANQIKFTHTSLSAMLISQLNNVAKQTIAQEIINHNDYTLEKMAWQIINNSVSIETMLEFNFNSKKIVQPKKTKKPVNKTKVKIDTPKTNNSDTLLKTEAENIDLQELKFIQAKNHKSIAKYKKNISLIWFAISKTKNQIPIQYLNALQIQLKFFQQFRQHMKFTLLTDYITFKNNKDYLISLVKKYGNRFEIELVEDIYFQDTEIQKVHEYFLKQQYIADPVKASKFYQVAYNLENSISAEVQHNVYFSFHQFLLLTQENIWDKLKRMLHLEQNKLITLLKKLFKNKGTSTINGNKFLYVPEINIKKTILQRNSQ
jgi:hypothetical protein